MPADPSAATVAVPVIPVPEVRDFVRINAEIVALLNAGHRRVRLEGAENQRLLAAGLVGPWDAEVEVVGPTGPEFGANLDAPGLRLIARGPTRDGAGRGLKAGTITILGDAGDGLGAAMRGGTLVATGDAGHRVGLNQAGGTLAVLGGAGRLAGDRQAGGWLFLGRGEAGPFAGRGQLGGRRLAWGDPIDPDGRDAWARVVAAVAAGDDRVAVVRP